jgi:hypothetical protein
MTERSEGQGKAQNRYIRPVFVDRAGLAITDENAHQGPKALKTV